MGLTLDVPHGGDGTYVPPDGGGGRIGITKPPDPTRRGGPYLNGPWTWGTFWGYPVAGGTPGPYYYLLIRERRRD